MSRLLYLMCLLALPALAAEPEDLTLDAKARARVVDAVIAQVRTRSYSPEKAARAEQRLRARLKRGEYDGITSARKLAEVLGANVVTDAEDAHAMVMFSPRPLPRNLPLPWEPPPPGSEERRAQRQEAMRQRARWSANGIARVERLDGNVGYLQLTGFPGPELAGEAATAAMTLLNGTDALILDLRGNGGGDDATVALYLGWLLPEAVHVLDTVWKGRGTIPLSTPAYLPAGRYGDKEVYVLTDKDTFSAGETLAYDLQARKRARVVGEKTGGGANAAVALPADEHFLVGVSMGLTVHAVTKSNWEGVGVKPDVAVPAGDALRTAHVAALTTLAKRALDPMQAEEIRAALAALGVKP